MKIIRNLTARRCSVPQSFGITIPPNVISGEFMRRGEADWAVLCSRNGFSSILIFRAGSVKSVSEIAKVADITFLQTIDGNGDIGFSRAICVVGRNYIRQHYRWYGGPKPPRINHQGINDVFVGKASTVLYYHSRKWLKLQGAD